MSLFVQGCCDSLAVGGGSELGKCATNFVDSTLSSLHRLVLDELSEAQLIDWSRGCIGSASVRARRGRADRAQPD